MNENEKHDAEVMALAQRVASTVGGYLFEHDNSEAARAVVAEVFGIQIAAAIVRSGVSPEAIFEHADTWGMRFIAMQKTQEEPS